MNLEKKMDEFAKIAEKFNLKTTFCLYEIENLNEEVMFGNYMTDGISNVRVLLPNKKLSYLELWKYADMLFDTIKNGDHLFIESFNTIQNEDGIEIQVFFGS